MYGRSRRQAVPFWRVTLNSALQTLQPTCGADHPDGKACRDDGGLP